MKKYILLLFVFALAIFQSCSTQDYLDKATVDNLVKAKEFTFMAKRAVPSSNDVARVMVGSIQGSTRLLDLDYGYTLEVTKSKITSTLPYFGRMYTPTSDPDKQSYRFSSEKFTYQESVEKKNVKVITIRPNDVTHVQRIVMLVYPNGRAYLTIEATDRQLISYDGYLMKNDTKK